MAQQAGSGVRCTKPIYRAKTRLIKSEAIPSKSTTSHKGRTIEETNQSVGVLRTITEVTNPSRATKHKHQQQHRVKSDHVSSVDQKYKKNDHLLRLAHCKKLNSDTHFFVTVVAKKKKVMATLDGHHPERATIPHSNQPLLLLTGLTSHGCASSSGGVVPR